MPMVFEISGFCATLLYILVYFKMKYISSFSTRNYKSQNRRVLLQMLFIAFHHVCIQCKCP